MSKSDTEPPSAPTDTSPPDASTHNPQAMAGDQQTMVLAAFDRYEPPLTLYASRLYGGDLHAAGDAVQQTFMKLIQQPVEKILHKIGPWLYTVCRNWVLDDLRRKSRQAQSLHSDFEPIDRKASDPIDCLQRREILDLVYRRIQSLPPAQRDSMELWAHGFKSQEIAEILGRDAGTIRVQLHRSIKRLRQDPGLSIWLERATGQVDSDATQTAGVSSNSQNAPVKVQESQS